MREKGLIVDGFHFSSSKEYEEAKKELESVNLLRSKAELSNPRTVLKVYSKLLESETFHTPVGYAFLKDLQGIILKSQIIKPDDLPGIYIVPISDSKEKTELNNLNLNQYKQQVKKQQTRLRNSRIINLFLVIIVIVMVIMTFYTDRTMFSNYKNQVIDQYASWEEELNNKEKELNEKELELNQKEQELNQKEQN